MRNNHGFTLLELLVSMSIVTLVCFGFFKVINSSIRVNVKNEKDIQSLQIAQSELENIREQIKEGITDNFKTTEGKEIKVNENTPEYKYNRDNKDDVYNIKIDLNNNDELYTIKVSVRQSNEYFSKKDISLITEVFGG